MDENEIARLVVDCCYQLHLRVGPGLFESVYEELLVFELEERGVICRRQVEIPLLYRGRVFPLAFRADIVAAEKLLIEVKSIPEVLPVHYKQLLTYLRLTDSRLGLLVNFNESLIKDGITRVVNNL